MGKKYPGFSLPSAFHSPSRAFQVLNPNAGQLDLGTGPTQCSGGSLSVMQGEDLKAKGNTSPRCARHHTRRYSVLRATSAEY